jgi:hypothetical protein
LCVCVCVKVSSLYSTKDEEVTNEDRIESSLQLIKILKEIELEMQTMHSKLNDMNEIGEQIGTQLNNSPLLSNSINNKMDVLENKWNALLEQMEYLSKVCTELQQIEIIKAKIAAESATTPTATATTTTTTTNQSEINEQSNSIQNQNNHQKTTDQNTTNESSSSSIKKRRVQTNEEIIQFKNVESFANKLNKTLDNIKSLLSNENPNKEEQQDLIRVI